MIVLSLVMSCLVAQAPEATTPIGDPVVSAPPEALMADDDYRAALELYQELEFEQAIFKLQDAALVETWGEPERALIFTWMGVNYAQLGDEASARRSFLHAARRDPNIVLPTAVSPTVLGWFEQSVDVAVAEATARAAADNGPANITVSDVTRPVEPAEEEVSEPPIPALAAGAGGAASAGLALMALSAAGYFVFITYTQYISAQQKELTQRDATDLIDGANLALYLGIGATGAAATAAAAAATLGILAATFLSQE